MKLATWYGEFMRDKLCTRKKYSQVLFNAAQCNIVYSTLVTMAEDESECVFTICTPYLAFMGELSGVYCDEFGENWPRYNGTALYHEKLSTYWEYYFLITIIAYNVAKNYPPCYAIYSTYILVQNWPIRNDVTHRTSSPVN